MSDRNEFFKRIKSQISDETNVPIEITFDVISTKTEILIKSKEFDYGFKFEYESEELTNIISDRSKWESFISKIVADIFDRMFLTIKTDLDKITAAYQLFWELCAKGITFPDDVSNKNLPFESLDIIATQTFLYRIGTHCRTLSLLFQNCDRDTVYGVELSIGVILRSCVLDSLYIFAWGTESKLISAFASESFLKTYSGMSAAQIKQYGDYAKYLNVDNIEKPGDEVIFKNVIRKFRENAMVNTMEYEKTYMDYSKYDHFSLVPFVFPKSDFQKLDSIVDALHLIKHAVCQLIALTETKDIEQFYTILDIRMELDLNGFYTFTNKH
ncbi:hypothetical protein Dfri01_39230 [Dyadobacter frigoris]|uniref:hypothetical protein n=1 Tax=Dyadobacter frigoris TaxID=2576211 RepID=UPI0024A3D223|nr:hypothetical protein [Dyadobacter frigoris]GLU54462.1 hypothetical protein Dfri01_39230 [Dyadobacter frigoris]